MRQTLFIHAAVAISPQETFNAGKFLKPVLTSDSGKLFAIDAPYSQYISPVAIRRMSRIMKMTISAGMHALKESGISTPDAIITGTGRGGVTDMEHFVKDMIRLDEGAMNPTLFIQSTYNSPNGWIAMQSNSTGYNQTYVHRGCSFELALQDTQMLVAEASGPIKVLTGCFDELTDEYYYIRGKRGYWKEESFNSMSLFDHTTTAGTIAGEGASFFVFSNERSPSGVAVHDLRIIYDADPEKIADAIAQTLEAANLVPADVSLVVSGENGDARQNAYYKSVYERFRKKDILKFKHLCGEYDTASGFAMWLATRILSAGTVPDVCGAASPVDGVGGYIIIVNHYILGTASVILLGRHNTGQ